MLLKSFFTVVIGIGCWIHAAGQAKIYGAPQNGGEAFEIPVGATEVKATFTNIQSVELEPGTILVLFERYANGKTAGRHRLVTESDLNFQIGFKVAYAISFQNPKNVVMGFEEPNFSGAAVAFKSGRNIVPVDFGLSSIYIPKGVNVKLYATDPELTPDQEVEHRPMGAGIRPFIGADIDDKVRFIYVK